jgi:protein-tyrosine phosphatase
MLDFHNHLMPGVDDGAADIAETRSGIATMLADGITTIITTPHISASLENRGGLEQYLERVGRAWEMLESLVRAEFPKLRIERGFEVMLDIPHPKLDNPLLRLAGTTFALVEFPYMNIPPNSTFALRELRQAGYTPIVAHPERYSNYETVPGAVDEWRDAGALMQVNTGSLVGGYGARAKRIAWTILQEGQVDFIASDYHSRGKCTVAAAIAEMKRRGFESQAATLQANARKILDGQMPAQVPPFTGKPKPAWKRVLPWS